MVKIFSVAVLVFVLLIGGMVIRAQGPLGTPLAPPPGSDGPGQPLQPLPGVIGYPIPGYGQMLPTWQALPTPQPPQATSVPGDWYWTTAQVVVFIYSCPGDLCTTQMRLLPDIAVLLRWAGDGWVQIESGQFWGFYAHADLFR